MLFFRPAAVAGAVLLLGSLGFSTADAAATLSKSNLLPAGETITVNWTGLVLPTGLNSIVTIQQCVKNDSVPFNQLFDCSQATSINPSFATNGSTTFGVFGGDEPNSGEWGCGPLASIPKATCYVRVIPGNASNTATDEFYPVTFTATAVPGNEVPEVPLNVLLPLGAAAVLGGSVLIARRRQNNVA